MCVHISIMCTNFYCMTNKHYYCNHKLSVLRRCSIADVFVEFGSIPFFKNRSLDLANLHFCSFTVWTDSRQRSPTAQKWSQRYFISAGSWNLNVEGTSLN